MKDHNIVLTGVLVFLFIMFSGLIINTIAR